MLRTREVGVRVRGGWGGGVHDPPVGTCVFRMGGGGGVQHPPNTADAASARGCAVRPRSLKNTTNAIPVVGIGVKESVITR